MNYWIRPSFELNNISSTQKEKELINRVCILRDVTLDELKSSSRKRNIVESRFIIFHILVDYCNYSLKEAGEIFKKHHSTVIYGKETIKKLSTFDKRINNELMSLMDFVRYNFSLPKIELNKNYSKYVGVSWDYNTKKWKAQTRKNGKSIYIGLFKDEYEAHLAYQRVINKNK